MTIRKETIAFAMGIAFMWFSAYIFKSSETAQDAFRAVLFAIGLMMAAVSGFLHFIRYYEDE
jgi:hypothetical protein